MALYALATMNLFYLPQLGPENLALLTQEEAAHALQVLRLRQGDQLVVVDGRGTWAEAVIEQIHGKQCQISIHSRKPGWGLPSYGLHVAMAPTKQIDRFEWFIEKATEIGITSITPLLCDHSERKEVKHERLMRVAVAAMKQSMKAWHPTLLPMTRFDDFLLNETEGIKCIAHCREGEKESLWNAIQPTKSTTILIGPEGDFSQEEIMHAIQAGYHQVSLGYSRLRTETAGVVATHTVTLKNGTW